MNFSQTSVSSSQFVLLRSPPPPPPPHRSPSTPFSSSFATEVTQQRQTCFHLAEEKSKMRIRGQTGGRRVGCIVCGRPPRTPPPAVKPSLCDVRHVCMTRRHAVHPQSVCTCCCGCCRAHRLFGRLVALLRLPPHPESSQVGPSFHLLTLCFLTSAAQFFIRAVLLWLMMMMLYIV